MLVRFRVECRSRVELHEIGLQDIIVGRDPGADLVVDHPTVAPYHARILVRRNRLILADLGQAKTGTTRGRERVTAPVALRARECFRLGDVAFTGELAEDADRSLIGDAVPEGTVGAELESPDRGVRRYRIALASGGDGEIAVLDRSVGNAASAWLQRAARSGLSTGRIAGRGYFVEPVPAGLRLAALIDGVERRTVQLPAEATIASIALCAESVAAMNRAWGPHGAIDPRRVQLGVDGSVSLIRPGPLVLEPGATFDEYISPERRVTLEATVAGDAFALGVLGKVILHHRPDCPMRIRAICYWLAHADAARRPRDLDELARELRRAAQSAGLDPTCGHVARVARLLSPNLARPLATTAPREMLL